MILLLHFNNTRVPKYYKYAYENYKLFLLIINKTELINPTLSVSINIIVETLNMPAKFNKGIHEN